MPTITTDAVFEDGLLRPVQPLPLSAHQRVRLVIQVPALPREWPEDVAELYQEIADEDRRLAAAMEATVRRTWPPAGEQP
jgi:predicted DNA-binding antitoxin AbrB/MazE fold protein